MATLSGGGKGMASVYGVVRTLFDTVPRHTALRRMLRQKSPLTSPLTSFDYNGLVEQEIVPRLVLSHTSPNGHQLNPVVDALQFAPLSLEADAATLLTSAEQLLSDGYSVDELLVDVLAPAARNLGLMWEDDSVDFVEVTMALWRLQEVVREVSGRMPVPPVRDAPRALFSVMPGEQHSFGTVMIEDVFRRQGWETDLLTDGDRSTLISKVAENDYDILGITVSTDRFVEHLPALVRALRGVSRNPHIAIMLGGRAFASADERTAIDFGVDAVSGDARVALAIAKSLVSANRVSG
jgi:MerR family transcriptional regulator, light-induced transcriptional regulator